MRNSPSRAKTSLRTQSSIGLNVVASGGQNALRTFARMSSGASWMKSAELRSDLLIFIDAQKSVRSASGGGQMDGLRRPSSRGWWTHTGFVCAPAPSINGDTRSFDATSRAMTCAFRWSMPAWAMLMPIVKMSATCIGG